MGQTTAVLPFGSDLQRKAWLRKGLIQAASKSFWSPLTGQSKNAIVYQKNKSNAGDGHTVVFDFSGNITGKAVKGKETAYGKGERKRKFSDKITVARYRLVVDNGDKFDGVDIGDLNINEHSDSRSKLSDLFIRFKDQSLFDSAQGNLRNELTGAAQAPSHIIDLGSTFSYDVLLDIEKVLKTSQGFDTGGIRRPIDPFMSEDGKPMWMFVCDTAMITKLKQDTNGYQTIVSHADVRGNSNRLIKGIVGKLGNMYIVEQEQFFGSTDGTTTGWGMEDSSIELSGLRQYDGADPTTAIWTGQEGFDYASSELHSRGLILGSSALQLAMGKQPDYKMQPSQDFAITSETAVEFWMESQKVNLKAESSDYEQAKVTDLDYGCVVVDLKVGV